MSSSLSPRRAASPKAGPAPGRVVKVGPQKGPQTEFLRCPADIAIYGGAAGGGKTYALLLEFLRHIKNPQFGAVIFRRTSEQVRMEGGLWNESQSIYPLLGARGKEMRLEWEFPSGARIKFDSLQYEKDKLQFQGAQICGLGLDELTHFTESQFFYLLSRNRSTCGVRPYVRATTNPDATSWVKTFLAPWLDPAHPMRAKSGELRYMERDSGLVTWHKKPAKNRKSVTFVRSTIYDNGVLMKQDPGYLGNLKALSLVDRKRLLDGDWDVVEGGNLFKPEWFNVVDEPPLGGNRVRYWDLAATKPKAGRDPDYTVGVLMARLDDGTLSILDVRRVRESPLAVERLVRQTAAQDGESVAIRMEQEPGSAGVSVVDRFQRQVLAGYDFAGVRSTGDKTARAKPLSALAEAGHVSILRAGWNLDFLNELALFPTTGAHDDQVDAASGAFRSLVKKRVIELGFS